MQKAISYNGIDLGITNQKIALLGLVHKALRESKPLRIPPLVVYTQGSDERTRVEFFDFFQEKPIRQVLRSFAIELTSAQCSQAFEEVSGWQCFLEGADRFGEVYRLGDVALDGLTCQFIRALVPVRRIMQIAEGIKESLAERGVRYVLQMRIEKDWEGYSQSVLKSFPDEDNLPTANEILCRVKNRFRNEIASAFVLCDEAAMPQEKNEIREIAAQKHGINLFWKSDFIELNQYSSLILSMVDFDLGMSSECFVGTSRSTFSCFISFEKYCKRRRGVRSHFIYNTPSGCIEERFDNGSSVDPRLAMERTYLRTALLPPSKYDVSVPMSLSVHVSNFGEFITHNSIVRGLAYPALVAGDPTQTGTRHIEGITIEVSDFAPTLRYKTYGLRENHGEWVYAGGYSGTRGEFRPLGAFAIEIVDAAGLELDCVYAAIFSDSHAIIEARNGQKCSSKTGDGRLLCMHVVLRHKEEEMPLPKIC